MQFRKLLSVFLLVISAGSLATAQGHLVPGPPGGGGRPAPYPGGGGGGIAPRPPGGGGGLVPGPRPPGGHPGQPPRPPRPPEPPRPPRPPTPPPYYPPPSPPPYYPPAPTPPPYYPPPSQPGYGDYEVKRIYLSRDVYNQSIDLRLHAGINYGYQGWTITSVRANTRPNSPAQTVAQLVVDGRIWASQVNPGYQIYLVPQSTLILDQNARNVSLQISGGTYIDSIEVELRRGGGGYNPPSNPGYGQNIDISVYRSVYGNDRIDLTQYVDLYRYRGYRVEQVIVTATSRYGSSFVNLMINGNSQGQLSFNSSYSQRQSLWLSGQPVIGQGADSIVLYTSGDMTVETVTLVVR